MEKTRQVETELLSIEVTGIMSRDVGRETVYIEEYYSPLHVNPSC